MLKINLKIDPQPEAFLVGATGSAILRLNIDINLEIKHQH